MSNETWRTRTVQRIPRPARRLISTVRRNRRRRRDAARSVAEVFTDTYASGRWGGGGEPFDSGSGSHGAVAEQYAGYIRHLLRETGARTAVDVGCGDFRVAAQFVDCLDSYHGVDVVESLVARNRARFGGPGVEFSVLDATVDELPGADVCLIRQVLQHLGNRQVAQILRRCERYPLVVVTEHWPAPAVTRAPNVDKVHGPDTRLDRGSYVDIASPPFNRVPVEEVLRLAADPPQYRVGETIRTHLWRPTAPTHPGLE
jgi:hypothetical protein